MVGNTEKTPLEKFGESLDRLLSAAESETGQGKYCANFLLAWWNAANCGGFDLTDLWAVDASLARDMLVVMNGITQLRSYPDALGYGHRFERLVRARRPHLVSDREAS